MAGFLIPLGNMLGEAGAGVAEGQTQALKNQILRQQLSQSAAEFQNYQRQQQALPGALQSFFGEKGKALWALDPSGALASKYVMDMLESGRQSASLRSQAAAARQAGDEQRASSLEAMANNLDAGFKEGTAGQLSGALVNPTQESIRELTEIQKRQLLNQAGASASLGHKYGIPGYENAPETPAPLGGGGATGGPAPFMLGGSSGAGSPLLGTRNSRPTIALTPEEETKLKARLAGMGMTPGQINSTIYRVKSGGTLFPPTSGSAPSAPAPISKPVPPDQIQRIPQYELETLVGDKVVGPAAKVELLRRKALMPDGDQKKFLDNFTSLYKDAKVVEAVAPNLGAVSPDQVATMAWDYSTLHGWGLPADWMTYFTGVGATYKDLWNVATSGGKGGVQLLNQINVHFPHGAQNYFPDAPALTLHKLEQLVTDPRMSGLMAKRDAILRRQNEAENGKGAPFVRPEVKELLDRYRTP